MGYRSLGQAAGELVLCQRRYMAGIEVVFPPEKPQDYRDTII